MSAVEAIVEGAEKPRRRDRFRQWLRDSLRKLDGPIVELSDILYFGGIALVGIGAGSYDYRIGLIVTGALLLLTVKSLIHWIK